MRLSAMREEAIARDVSDLLFYIALALLPVDGTTLGIPLPYWTPLSPWFLIAYALVNWRYLRSVVRTFAPFFIFSCILVALSCFGWMTVNVHPVAIAKSFIGIVMFLACLASLEVMFHVKHASWKPAVTVLVVTYSFAFFVGIVQFVALKGGFEQVTMFFQRMMYRSYVAVRPQFLFAEPSYIGMHLFGVLLPVYWLTRDRRLPVLVGVFAIGSIAMGAGVRIILDCAMAVVLWCIAEVNFRKRAVRWGVFGGGLAIAGALAGAAIVNPRLRELAAKGLLAGDDSMAARVFHMLAPARAWWDNPWHFIFGFGAGNISDAVKQGYARARDLFLSLGGKTNMEIDGLVNPPANTFTMSAYSSFITEFGALAFIALAVMVLVTVTRQHVWNRTVVCWLILVVYLYVQFEAYGFYGVVLLVGSKDFINSPESGEFVWHPPHSGD